MYKRIPTQVAIAAFPTEDVADIASDELLSSLAEESNLNSLVCCNRAIITRSKETSKVKTKQYGMAGPRNGIADGAAQGTVMGAVVGAASLSWMGPFGDALGGTAGGLVGAGLGAVEGAVVGTVQGLVMKNMDQKNLTVMEDCLEPGSSLFIAFFDETIVNNSECETTYKECIREGERFVATTAKSIHSALRDGKAYGVTFSVSEEGITPTPALHGEDVHFVKLAALLMATAKETSKDGHEAADKKSSIIAEINAMANEAARAETK